MHITINFLKETNEQNKSHKFSKFFDNNNSIMFISRQIYDDKVLFLFKFQFSNFFCLLVVKL